MVNVKLTVSCQRCGRLLTNPKSIERRYGIICWKKLGLPLRVSRETLLKERKILPLEEYFGDFRDDETT